MMAVSVGGEYRLIVTAASGEMKAVGAGMWVVRSEVCVAFSRPYISVFWRGKFSLILQKMRSGGGFVQKEVVDGPFSLIKLHALMK